MTEPHLYPAGSYLVLTMGEYSDFSVAAHLVARRELNLLALAAEYREQFKPSEPSWQDQPYPEGFVAWLCVEGHAMSADVSEAHIGSYGRLEIDV